MWCSSFLWVDFSVSGAKDSTWLFWKHLDQYFSESLSIEQATYAQRHHLSNRGFHELAKLSLQPLKWLLIHSCQYKCVRRLRSHFFCLVMQNENMEYSGFRIHFDFYCFPWNFLKPYCNYQLGFLELFINHNDVGMCIKLLVRLFSKPSSPRIP